MTSMTSAVALVTVMAAGPDSAAFHPPSAERITILNEQLAQTRWVDVATDAGVFMVNEPRADAGGLVYRRRSGGPPKRSAVFFTVREVATPVPNPIPWSQIESVTWRRSGMAGGAIGGGIVGAVVAVGLVSIASIDGEPSVGDILMFGAGSVLAAGSLGALFGGMIESRQVLYHAPGSETAGSRQPSAAPGSFAEQERRAVLISPDSALSDSLRLSPR